MAVLTFKPLLPDDVNYILCNLLRIPLFQYCSKLFERM